MIWIKSIAIFVFLVAASGCSPISSLTTWSKAVKPSVPLEIGDRLVATPPLGDWRFEVYQANNLTGRLGSNYDELQHGRLYLDGCYEKGIAKCSFEAIMLRLTANNNDHGSVNNGVVPPNVEAGKWFRGMVDLSDFQNAITEIPNLGERPSWGGLSKKAGDIYQFGNITCLRITESTHKQRLLYRCPIANALGDITYVLAVTYEYRSTTLTADQALHMLKRDTEEFLRSMIIDL